MTRSSTSQRTFADYDAATDDILSVFRGVTFRVGSLYDAADWYDVDYAGYMAEDAFYRHAIALGLGEDAYVELGAGTGRLCLGYARDGVRVHAVEPAQPMLDALLEKAKALDDDAGLVTGEAQAGAAFLGPSEPIGVVAFPFNGLLHVHGHAELNATFAHIFTRLREGGLFAVDITTPSWDAMARGGLSWGRVDERIHPQTGARLLTCDANIYHPTTRVLTTRYRFVEEHADTGVELEIHQFMWTAQELLAGVERAGFELLEVFGDVDLSPLDERSPRVLVIARKP